MDINLRWKKSSECAGAGPGIALGLEATDSLNIAAWVSFEGISAVSYPEETACALFEKMSGNEFVLNKKVFSHSDFAKAVYEGIYPDFFLRRPLNKAEKKLLLGSYSKKYSNKYLLRDELILSGSKKDLREDGLFDKGAVNLYYIVNTKRNLFLTKSLSWLDIGSLKKKKKLIFQLFCVRDDIAVAQTISLWITPPGEITSPCTSTTLRKRYHLVFPNTSADSLTDGIRTSQYPSFLSRKPENRREVVAFQMALRNGIKDLEARTLLSLGQASGAGLEREGADSQADNSVDEHLSLEETNQKTDVGDSEKLLSDNSMILSESDSFSFQHHVSSVTESSTLIRSIIETFISFEKMMSEAQGLVSQRRLDLEIIQRQLLDLDHIAEFYSLNASDGYRMNKTRKEYLQRRRVIKNEILVLEMITHSLSNGATLTGISGLINNIMNLDRRCYTTRALTVSDVRRLIRNPNTQAQILGETCEPALEQDSDGDSSLLCGNDVRSDIQDETADLL